MPQEVHEAHGHPHRLRRRQFACRTADDIAQRRGQQSRLNRAEQDDRPSVARRELGPPLATPGNHDGATVMPTGNMEHSFRP